MSAAWKALTAAVGVVVVGGMLAPPAQAWPMPLTAVAGGDCLPDGSRREVVFVVTNLESERRQSPAVIDHVTVTPAFPRTPFFPDVLQNTGASIATSTMTVPPNWLGSVQVTYRMFWDGPDGTDIGVGSTSIDLAYCFPGAVRRRFPAGVRVRLNGHLVY